MNRDECITQIKEIEKHCIVAMQATAWYHEQCLANQVVLAGGLRPRDIREARKSLEYAYLVDLFAEFESVLRHYWKQALTRRTHPKMQTLLDAIAPRLFLPASVLTNAHIVRVFRNFIVHERSGDPPPAVALAEARKYLCVYLSNLPRQW